MTTLAEAQVEIIEAQAKLIKQQSMEIMQLEHKLEQREYNRRFTNTKFKTVDTTSLQGLEPKFTATINPKKVQRK
jgi:Fe-S cluster assembly ATPase SufC